MGHKTPGRKAKKRIPKLQIRGQALDDDLTTLAEVLDEHRLDNSIENWFSISWRDGWRAIELAFVLGQGTELYEVETFLRDAIHARNSSAEIYWQSAEMIQHCATSFRSRARYLYAAIRCLQVLSSNSSGGGEVYNFILRRALDSHDEHETGLTLDEVEAYVAKFRCFDALRLDDQSVKSEQFAKSIKAFHIAWKRGLYHAAYSIRPARLVSVVTTMSISGPTEKN